MQKTPLLILLGIVVIVGFFWLLDSEGPKPVASNNPEPIAETLTPTNTNSEPDDETTRGAVQVESPADSEADTSTVQELPTPEPTELVAGTYEKYSAQKVANADGEVVLFFKADWCPSCRSLDADIKQNLDDIPADVTILEVNYDTEVELKKKYGITTQHTLVQVDTGGNQIKKWSGSPRLSSVIAEL